MQTVTWQVMQKRVVSTLAPGFWMALNTMYQLVPESLQADRISASRLDVHDLQTQSEEAAAGMRSEVDIATAEVERAQQRLASLERERDALLAQVPPAPSSRALHGRNRHLHECRRENR